MTTPPAVPAAAAPGPVLVPADHIPDRLGAVAILSKISREGAWALPRALRVAAFMGQIDLDLTRVQIAPGLSEIEVMCVMGHVNIVAPHGLNIECTGDPILGRFSLKRVSGALASPDAPVVRIKGTALMGEVTVKVVDPAAPRRFRAWLEQRRVRRARGPLA